MYIKVHREREDARLARDVKHANTRINTHIHTVYCTKARKGEKGYNEKNAYTNSKGRARLNPPNRKEPTRTHTRECADEREKRAARDILLMAQGQLVINAF